MIDPVEFWLNNPIEFNSRLILHPDDLYDVPFDSNEVDFPKLDFPPEHNSKSRRSSHYIFAFSETKKKKERSKIRI